MLTNILIQDIIPNLPPESLRDYVFYSIFITTLFRLFIISLSYLKFRKILPEKKQIKALKLVGQLEIPGLKRYIFTQAILIIFPPIIAILGLYLFGLENSQWSDFYPTVSFLGFFGLLIWIIYEIHTIRKTGRELNAIIDDFENFLLDTQKWLDEKSEYIPDVIDIINPFSKIKGKEPDTYIDLLMLLVEVRRYTRSTSKWLRKKSPYFVNENIFPFMGSVGKSITQSIQYLRDIPQSFVENTVANVSDILTEEINKKLAKLFPVTQTSISEATKTILKSAAPTIWLCLLILIHDYLL